MSSPGDRVRDVFRKGTGEAIVVSPFITLKSFQHVVQSIGSDAELRVYTRWLPLEVALGVSDLRVFDYLQQRGRSSLYLCRRLHAKAYVRDNRALVGSANATNSGLGWSGRKNIEVMIDVASDDSQVEELIEELETRSIPATIDIRSSVERAAKRVTDGLDAGNIEFQGLLREGLREWKEQDNEMRDRADDEATSQSGMWLPRTSEPRRLYDAYSADASFSLLESTKVDARADLSYLQVPPGLTETQFAGYVRAALSQTELYAVVENALKAGEDPYRALQNAVSVESEQWLEDRWSVILDWLMHFFPDRFRTDVPGEAYRIVKSRTVE